MRDRKELERKTIILKAGVNEVFGYLILEVRVRQGSEGVGTQTFNLGS